MERPSAEALLGREILESGLYARAAGWKTGTPAKELSGFFLSEEKPEDVALLSGLRRTGKTAAFMHAVRDIAAAGPEELDRTAYLNVDGVPWIEVERFLKKLKEQNFRNVLIDEATQSQGFLQRCGLLSDAFSDMGMRIALAGRNSLAFFLAARTGLFDRCRMIRTTRIPFPEWSALQGGAGLSAYLRWGGALDEAPAEGMEGQSKHPFAVQNADGWFMSSISRNIQQTLESFYSEDYEEVLTDVFEADRMHDAALAVFRNLVCGDLLMAAEGKAEGAFHEFLHSQGAAAGSRLAGMLDMRDGFGRELITPSVRHDLVKCLEALDALARRPVKAILPLRPTASEMKKYDAMQPELRGEMLVSQPGLRFLQTRALEDVLDGMSGFQVLPPEDRRQIKLSLRRGAEERLLEDIVLQETMEAAEREGLPRETVFKAVFPFEAPGSNGEFDMAVSLPDEGCWIFEVKRSCVQDDRQFRHLVNADFCARIEKSEMLPVAGRTVLYMGAEEKTVDVPLAGGTEAASSVSVSYCNAEKFLHRIWRRGLPATLKAGCMDEPESGGEVRPSP